MLTSNPSRHQNDLLLSKQQWLPEGHDCGNGANGAGQLSCSVVARPLDRVSSAHLKDTFDDNSCSIKMEQRIFLVVKSSLDVPNRHLILT